MFVLIGTNDPRLTIAAIGSATNSSLRGIVRITGEDAISVLREMCHGELQIASRAKSYRVTLTLPEPIGNLEVTALVWPTTRAYTGSPSVEIQTFGCGPILDAVLQRAISAGARPAGPGEFTMRAFLAGRLDLTQAEAVLGVIDASNRAQLDAALMQLAGNVATPLRLVREELLNLLADVEAGLDFVDEDISFIDDSALRSGLHTALATVRSVAEKMVARRRNESFHWVALRGLPNAGKSSLLNAIARENVAIVSETAGTTRDVVWKTIQLEGYEIRLADTAGVESIDDETSRQSQTAGKEIIEAASIVVNCVDARHLSPTDLASGPMIDVATKADVINEFQQVRLREQGWLLTSAIRGDGIEDLSAAIVARLSELPSASDTGVPGTAARCQDSVARAVQALGDAINLVDAAAGQEFIAAEIRQALVAIGEVTGEIYTDDILDRVFSRFCIGK